MEAIVGIRDDLKHLDRVPKTFAAWKLTAPADDIAAVEEACRDLTLNANQVIAVCKRNGIPISKETVKTYR